MGRKGTAYITASRGGWAVGPEWEDVLHKLHLWYKSLTQEAFPGELKWLSDAAWPFRELPT